MLSPHPPPPTVLPPSPQFRESSAVQTQGPHLPTLHQSRGASLPRREALWQSERSRHTPALWV